MNNKRKHPAWLTKAVKSWYMRYTTKLELKSNEPMGSFCDGCNGKACWCQTWEPTTKLYKILNLKD